VVNIYGKKKNIDKEYGREGMWWVDVNNEEIVESNSWKWNMAFALIAQKIRRLLGRKLSPSSHRRKTYRDIRKKM
jgi:hypothetical protein